MGFNIQFNAHTVEPNLPPAALPTGEYDVIIVSTDEKPTKNGGGQTFYEIVMQVISPPEFKGRRIVDRLNCKNQNEQAREIAYATLSSICYVTGIFQIQQSSAELHGKPFRIAAAKVPRSDDPTKDGNEIRGYFDMNGNDAGTIKAAATGGGSSGGKASSGFGDETSSGNSSFGTDSNAGGADTGASFGGTAGGSDDNSSGGDDEVPPRIIELMVEQNLEYEAAVAAYEAELAAASAPKETPQQIAARKAAEAAKAKAAAAATASAAKSGGGNAAGGPVPDWAQQ